MILRIDRRDLFRHAGRDIRATFEGREHESILDDDAFVGVDLHPPAADEREIEIVTVHGYEEEARSWAAKYELDILAIKQGVSSKSETFRSHF